MQNSKRQWISIFTLNV